MMSAQPARSTASASTSITTRGSLDGATYPYDDAISGARPSRRASSSPSTPNRLTPFSTADSMESARYGTTRNSLNGWKISPQRPPLIMLKLGAGPVLGGLSPNNAAT